MPWLQLAAKRDGNRREQILAMLAQAFQAPPPLLPSPPDRQLPLQLQHTQDSPPASEPSDSGSESSSCTDIAPSLSIPDSKHAGLRTRSLMSLLQV